MSIPNGAAPRPEGAASNPFLRRVSAVWRWLTQTPGAASDAERRQARLVAGVGLSLLLLLLSTSVLLLVMASSNPAPLVPVAYIFFASASLLLAALVINRQRRGRAAAGLVLLVAFVDTWSAVLVNRSTHNGGVELLFYPLLSIILSGLLLPASATAIITAGNLVALFVLSTLPDQTNPGAALGPAIFYVGISVLSGLASTLRQRDLDRLDARERALADSEAKYRRIVDLAQEGIWIVDADNRTTFVNHRLTDMLGYAEAEMLGTDFMGFVDEASRAEVKSYWERPLQGLTDQYDIKLRRHDGAELWVIVAATPLRDHADNYTGILALVADITDRKWAEQALQAANDKLTAWLTESEARTRDMTLLAELGDLLQTSLTAEEAYVVVAQLMLALFPEAAGRLYVMRQSRNLVEAVSQWGSATDQAEPFEPSQCWALRRGHTHVVQSISPDPRAGQLPTVVCDHVSRPWPLAYFCVPMVAQNETLGVLYLEQPAAPNGAAAVALAAADGGPAWTEAQLRLARTVADSLALALANLRLRETLRLQSIRNTLTGLFNRRYLEETLDREMHRARREHRPLGVTMLDIDHLKQFNDVLGHEAGDQVLRGMGSLLKSQARAEDIACRYGGEEFIFIMPGASLEVTRERAEALCRSVHALGARFDSSALGPLTISAGVAAYPEQGDDGPDIMRAADATLFQAKRAGRDRVVVCA